MGCQNTKKKQDPKNRLRTKGECEQDAIECKIVLLGDAGVGKSSIAERFCKNEFNDKYEVTIGGAYL